MSNILYISDHAVLEYDELQLFTDMGHDVFSMGAYHALGGIDLPRPAIQGLKYHEDLDQVYIRNPNRNNIQQEIIDWADIIIFMHAPRVLVENWQRIKHKKVIWRSIGQSVQWIEKLLKPLYDEGLTVVRYSPKERNIRDYMGETALIRFYKDPDVYQGWTGEDASVVNFSQTLKGRRDFCHYDEIFPVIEQFDGRVYGTGNEDLGKYNGGQIPFDQMLDVMRKARVLPYGGTWPAPYTLSFMEALMIGLPVVAISKAIAHIDRFEGMDFYEVDEMLAEISGPVCDTAQQMIVHTSMLINNHDLAKELSVRQRQLAIKYFGKETISKEWESLFSDLEKKN